MRNYIDTVELVIQSDNFDDPVNGYSKYIDVESFIDYFIHTELSLNADGFKRSAYFYKEKQKTDGSGGKLFAGSVWDYNLAFGICNFCNGNKIDSWVFDGCETNPTPAIWKRLIQDPNFINAVKCRYLELRENILSEAYLFSFIDKYAAMLDEAKERHFEKWEELFEGESGWSWGGMWGGGDLWFNAYFVTSYSEEINIIKNW
ncbi:MAG: CotH kinase family protein [Prolixibacteraceae bacterium]|nr:CotH kinase family protein [Prolixibacteraceae bacterium]